MDDPSLASDAHTDALRGLARINRLSFASRAHLASLMAVAGLGSGPASGRVSGPVSGPVRVLDVAAGSGDVAASLARRAHRAGVAIDLTMADISPVAVDACRERAGGLAGLSGVTAGAVRLDALHDPLPECDLAVCSLFLHHLDSGGARLLLENLLRSGCRMVSVSDLRRSAWGTLLARVVPRVVTRSYVVHTDAVRSARAAWTAGELVAIAAEAGMAGAVVRRAFPARMTLVWSRP
jgi:SAM-dependent methyltransferase